LTTQNPELYCISEGARKIVMEKKYYKTKIVVEVLSENPYRFNSLYDLDYGISEGHYVGNIVADTSVEVSREEMSNLLVEFRSDPDFFEE